jgi:hypothetical protein
MQDRKPQPNVDEVTQETIKSVDVVCAICLEPIQPSSSCTFPCSHSFHSRCVSNLRSQSTSQVCPLCRTDLPPTSSGELTHWFRGLSLNDKLQIKARYDAEGKSSPSRSAGSVSSVSSGGLSSMPGSGTRGGICKAVQRFPC